MALANVKRETAGSRQRLIGYGDCRRLVEETRPDMIHSDHLGTTYVMRLALGKQASMPRIFQRPPPLKASFARFRATLHRIVDHVSVDPLTRHLI